MVSIDIGEGALKDLREIDPVISKRIVAKIVWLEQNFASILPDRLHHELRELYKLRIGDYRAIYSVHHDHITIEAVRHRREVYK